MVQSAGGGIAATVGGTGAANDSAYATVDFGRGSEITGAVVTGDRIALGLGQSATSDLQVLQITDSAGRVVYRLVISAVDRTLWVESPAGGLSAEAIAASTHAVVPNDGHSSLAVSVTVSPNDFLAARVNGREVLRLAALNGGAVRGQRYMAVGIIAATPTASAGAGLTSAATQTVSVTHDGLAVTREQGGGPSTPNPGGGSSGSAASLLPSGPPIGAAEPVTAVAPVPVTEPRLSGSPQLGSDLTSAPGTWSDPQAALRYSWERCDASGEGCHVIEQASGPTLTLTAADVGFAVRVHVRASNGGGSATASSPLSAVINPPAPTAITAPVLSGSATAGSTLVATTAGWSDASSYAYAWERCDSVGNACTAILGATDPSLALSLADLGASFRAVVTATGAGGSTSMTSAPSTPVRPPTPANTAAPTISGDPVVGATLIGSTGTGGDPSAQITYVWTRCDSVGACTQIEGATGSSYLLVDADKGSTIGLTVTATNGGRSSSASATPTVPVTAAPLTTVPAPANAAAPTISGDLIVGATLTGSTGTWGDPSAQITYVWTRCDSVGACTQIEGATGSSYLLVDADKGSTIGLTVTATNGGGSSSASATPTGPVTAAPPITAPAPAPAATPAPTPAADPRTPAPTSGSGDGTSGSSGTASPAPSPTSNHHDNPAPPSSTTVQASPDHTPAEGAPAGSPTTTTQPAP